jgi:hypothetical protein
MGNAQENPLPAALRSRLAASKRNCGNRTAPEAFDRGNLRLLLESFDMKFRHALLLAGATLIATPALAQDTAAPAEAAPQASTAAPSAVTDAELKQFAKAALAVDKVSKDAAVPAADKQKRMADAVSSSGLPPARFNEIAQASQADPALQQKVQAAIVAEQQSAPTQ